MTHMEPISNLNFLLCLIPSTRPPDQIKSHDCFLFHHDYSVLTHPNPSQFTSINLLYFLNSVYTNHYTIAIQASPQIPLPLSRHAQPFKTIHPPQPPKHPAQKPIIHATQFNPSNVPPKPTVYPSKHHQNASLKR